MRFSFAVAAAAVASVAFAEPIPQPGFSLGFSTTQTPLRSELSVPGDNPLFYCEDPKSNILSIERVDLSPNPPKPGATLTILARGNFTEPVKEGSYVQLQVKYGLIVLIKQKADLCEHLKEVDLECPIPAGEAIISKEVALPKEIPPGTYSVVADVYTADDDHITCLTATVQFSQFR